MEKKNNANYQNKTDLLKLKENFDDDSNSSFKKPQKTQISYHPKNTF